MGKGNLPIAYLRPSCSWADAQTLYKLALVVFSVSEDSRGGLKRGREDDEEEGGERGRAGQSSIATRNSGLLTDSMEVQLTPGDLELPSLPIRPCTGYSIAESSNLPI